MVIIIKPTSKVTTYLAVHVDNFSNIIEVQ